MRKIIAIIIAYFFLQGNVGFSLVKHYCGDALALQKILLFTHHTSHGTPGGSGQTSAKGANDKDCHTEVLLWQVDDSLRSRELASVGLVSFVLFIVSFAPGGFLWSPLASHSTFADYAPPHRCTSLRFRAFLQIFRH